MHGVWLIGHSKLAVGVNVSVHGGLCLLINWRCDHGVPRLLPCDSWYRFQLNHDPEPHKQKKMDGCSFNSFCEDILLTD